MMFMQTFLTLYDMLEFPPGLEDTIKPFVADYPMNLIQMTKLSKEVRGRLTSDFRLLAEYVALKDDPVTLIQYMKTQNQPIRHPEEFLDVLSTVSGDRRYRSIQKQILERAEREEEEITMCVLIDEFENIGRQKGIEEGIQKGIQKGIEEGSNAKTRTIAHNMFLRGMSVEDTAGICEEQEEQVRTWFSEWRKI